MDQQRLDKIEELIKQKRDVEAELSSLITGEPVKRKWTRKQPDTPQETQ